MAETGGLSNKVKLKFCVVSTERFSYSSYYFQELQCLVVPFCSNVLQSAMARFDFGFSSLCWLLNLVPVMSQGSLLHRTIQGREIEDLATTTSLNYAFLHRLADPLLFGNGIASLFTMTEATTVKAR